jgi:cytochrome c551/c552
MKNKADMLNPGKISRAFVTVLSSALVFGTLSLVAAPLKIQLPPETAIFKAAPGVELANAQCLVCHSVEYVQMQPPKPLDFWAAEVKKMRDKYGAQYPAEDNAALADYLARTYGTATNSAVPVSAVTNSTTSATSQPVSVEALATKYACLSCHKVNVKVVGPAFKDVAAKYHNDPAALDKVLQQIRKGGSGKWGPTPMPPFPNTLVSDAQAEMLGRWILSQEAAK